jgi:hypothetical protein
MRPDEVAVLNAAQVRATSGVVIEGPPGPRGPEGPTGPEGPRGPAGRDGADGQDGTDGADAPLKVRSVVGRDYAGRISEITDYYADGTVRLHRVARAKRTGRVTEIIAVE